MDLPVMMTYNCLPQQRLELGDYAIAAVQPEHIERIRQWRNAQLDVLRQTAPLTPEQQERYFATQVWPDMKQPRPANILVSYFLEGRHIGYGGLVHIAWEHRRAEVSFLTDPSLANDAAGYARHFSNFLALVKVLAFTGLRLHRLFTETYAMRAGHIATLEQSGFRCEGVMREHVLVEGRPMDSIIHGCLKNDAG